MNYNLPSYGRFTNSISYLQRIGIRAFLLALITILFGVNANAQVDVSGSTGANGSYATLKGAFDVINANTNQSGNNIVIGISGNTTETLPAVLNQPSGGSWATLTISPTGGAARTISGAMTAGATLLDLNGADNVTIDGLNSGGNSLTISNTTVSATSGTSTMRFIADATNNTITNCTILGSSTMTTTTNGGTIFFSTAGTPAQGNDNNTISFCNIGPASSTPAKAIYANGTTTTSTHYNSGNLITNCNIFDFFHASSTSNGIYFSGGNIGWTISNNRFYQTTARTQTTGALHNMIQMASTTAQAMTISGNIFGFANSSGTGVYSITGPSSSTKVHALNMSSAPTTGTGFTNFTGNTISGFAISGVLSGTTTTAPFYAAYLLGESNFTNNTVGSLDGSSGITFTSSSTSTSDIYAVYNNSSSSTDISGNNIGNITMSNSSTGGILFTGIRPNTGSAGFSQLNNNTIGSATGPISNTAVATASRVVGINAGIAYATITGNTISNMSCSSSSTSTGSSASVVGIIQTGTSTSGSYNVSNNTIHTLANNNTTASTSVYGIHYTGPVAGTNVIANNNIKSLNNASTSATADIRGINIAGGTSTIFNNMVRVGIDENGNDINEGISIHGIYDANTVATGNNYYFNTVYVGGSAVTGASTATYAFRSDGVTNTRSFRNNIFHNARSNSSGTGIHYAVRIGGTSPNPTGLTMDNNCYRADGNGGMLGSYNSFDQVDLSAWQGAVGLDGTSIEEVPNYFNATGNAASVNLRIDWNAGATGLESGGVNIAGITADFDAEVRQGNIGYAGGGSAPDIGADEFEGTALSGCSGTPAASNAQTTTSTPCTGVNFTLSLDVAYGIGYAYQWESSTTGPSTGFSPIGGASNASLVTNVTGTTWFRCEVTCVTSSLSTTSSSVEVTLTPLSGSYTVQSSGGDYVDFSDVIADLNCKGTSGHVVFTVADDEVFSGATPLNFTFSGSVSSTVTFVRSNTGTNNPKIQRAGTSATTDFIVKLTGVDYYTFDGIDFEQTGTSSADWAEYGIHIQNASATDGAKFNTFKNGTITLSSSNSGSKGGYIQSSPTPTNLSGTNSNNRFLNMNVASSFEGYRFAGATSTYMDDANEINTEFAGISRIQNLGDGTVSVSMYGVFASYQTNLIVSNTEISNLLPGGTSLCYGITMQSSSSNTATISNNHIHSITGGGIVYAVYGTLGADLNIDGNEIHAISTTSNTSAVRGVYFTGTGINATIQNNRIFDLSSPTTSTGTVAGIDVATGLVYNIYNNMISDLRAPASTTSSGGTRGISVSGGSTGGVVKIYHNTVHLTDVATAANYTSAGIHNSSTTPTLDIRNNIIVNNSDISGGGLRVAAFWKTTTTDNVDNNSDNNLYYAGSPDNAHLIYYDGTNAAQSILDYNALPAIFPGESVSQTENVILNADVQGYLRLDINTATVAESGGQVITLVTTDIDGDARTGYPLGGQSGGGGIAPDMGADEGDFTFFVQPVPDCSALISPADLTTGVCQYSSIELKWAVPTSGGTVTGGYDLYFGTDPSPSFLLNTSGLNHTVVSVAGNTTYYWQVVPKGNSGDASGCPIYSFTTSNSEITGVTNDTRCGTGTVNLSASSASTVNWYNSQTGGASLFTGTNYSPIVSATTTYYVGASDGLTVESVGRSESLAGSSATTASTWGLVFNAASSITLDSVTVILGATSGGTLVMQLRDSLAGSTGPGTNIVASASIPIPTGTIGQRVRIPVGFNVPAGDGYRLLAISSPSLVRTSSAGGYPYISSGGSATITSGFITNSGSSTYYFFYDWAISSICESPRQAVTATVTPADPIMVTPSSATICDNASTSLTASSTYAYNYTWSPATGLNTTSGASVNANPATTTTYTVTGDDGTCANQTTVTVTVIPSPTVNAAVTLGTICAGESTSLSSTASAPINSVIFSENFNSGVGSFATENLSTGGTPALADWTARTSPYLYSSVNYSSNDNSGFMMSNSDEQGSGGTTLTRLTSPAFNLSGLSSASLSFFHYYRYNATGEEARVQVSTDGVTWNPLQTYTSTQGGAAAFSNPVLSLNAYLGNASVQVRFEYSASYDWYWAIDNVVISGGLPHSYSWTSTPAGFTSSVQNPGLVSPADDITYHLVVTSSQGCVKTSDAAVVVNDNPVASAASNSPVCIGEAINLTSNGGGTYAWTGPNGFTSNDQNPSIAGATATEAGLYSVTVTLNGCTDMTSTNVNVVNCQVPCVTPVNLTTTSITGSSATLGWNSNVTGDAFVIRYYPAGATLPGDYLYANIPGPNPTNSFNVMNLLPGTTYTWQVKTICTAGAYSPYSPEEMFVTLSAPQQCGRPMNPFMSGITATTAQMNWIPMSANSFTMRITNLLTNAVSWQSVAGTNESFGVIANITPNTDYEVMVLANCGAPTGSSRYSSVVMFTTLSAAAGSLPCATPYDVRGINITTSSADVEWNAAVTADQFRARYALDNGLFNWTYKTVNGAGGVVLMNISGLAAATDYVVQVQSLCTSPVVKSKFSDLAYFSTAGIPRMMAENDAIRNVNVYPNPAVDKVSINFELAFAGTYEVKLTDLTGRELNIISSSAAAGMVSVDADLNGLAKGVYLVSIVTNEGSIVSRLIIQ